MKSSIEILLVTAMVVAIPFVQAHKVAALTAQFKNIFQAYLKYRMTESNPNKLDAVNEVVRLLDGFQLRTDKGANFTFGLIDLEAFVDKGALDSQLRIIFKVGDTDPVKLEFPWPSRIFKKIAPTELTFENFKKISTTEQFVRKSYAKQAGKSKKDVALEYELIEAVDLKERDDTSPKKEYMLFMLAVGTNA